MCFWWHLQKKRRRCLVAAMENAAVVCGVCSICAETLNSSTGWKWAVHTNKTIPRAHVVKIQPILLWMQAKVQVWSCIHVSLLPLCFAAVTERGESLSCFYSLPCLFLPPYKKVSWAILHLFYGKESKHVFQFSDSQTDIHFQNLEHWCVGLIEWLCKYRRGIKIMFQGNIVDMQTEAWRKGLLGGGPHTQSVLSSSSI